MHTNYRRSHIRVAYAEPTHMHMSAQASMYEAAAKNNQDGTQSHPYKCVNTHTHTQTKASSDLGFLRRVFGTLVHINEAETQRMVATRLGNITSALGLLVLNLDHAVLDLICTLELIRVCQHHALRVRACIHTHTYLFCVMQAF